eukprot:696674-Pelagomonas_calceolata.AAC.1
MSGTAQLNQRSDGVAIIDSACNTQEDGVQGYLTYRKATGAEPGNGTCIMHDVGQQLSCRLGKGYHLRVEMGGSPLDMAQKYGIGTALTSGKGASTIGKSPVRNFPGD